MFPLKMILSLLPYGCGEERPPSERNCPDCDRDGDRVPDLDDACPDIYSETPDGCPAKALLDSFEGEKPVENDPVPPDFTEEEGDPEIFGDLPVTPLPRPLFDSVFRLSEQPACPQVAWRGNGGVLAWQAGPSVKIADLNEAGESVSLSNERAIGQTGEGDFRFCNIQRGVAISPAGARAVFWGELKNGNQIDLKLRIDDREAVVATTWLPPLGLEKRNTLAAVTALEDERFLAVWLGGNHDKLMGQIFSPEAEPASEPALLYRDRDVLLLSDPDVISLNDGNAQTVWKEGDAPMGTLRRATCRITETGLEAEHPETLEESAGQWPSLFADQEEGPFYVWRGDEGRGILRGGNETFLFGDSVLSPRGIVNPGSPPLLGWSEALRAGAENVLVGVPDAGEIRAVVVGEGIAGSRFALSAWRTGTLIVFAPQFPEKSLRFIGMGWSR